MSDISRLFQAFLPPAIFISATGLLVLSINARLMGMVSRLRQFVHAKHDAAKNGHLQEAEAFTAQIKSIEKRAEMIRRCFLCWYRYRWLQQFVHACFWDWAFIGRKPLYSP
jgi:Protein of unknown function (DUF2721)